MDNTVTVNMKNLTQEEREQLVSLLKKSNERKSKKRWRAYRNGGKYYWICTDGHIFEVSDYGRESDDFCYRTYNYFKTKKEAEFEIEKRLVYQELKDYALEHNESEIDWNNKGQYKYYIFCNNKEILIGSDNTTMYLGQIYFTSREIARNAINLIGEDRIKKYLFGVEED